MPQASPMKFTLRHQAAAKALAQGERIEQAAIEAGKSVRTIHQWQQRPEFTALVDQYREDMHRMTLAQGIANRNVRLLMRNKRAQQLAKWLDEEMAKPFRNKDTIKNVSQLLRLELDNEKQAAIEANQWNQKLVVDLNGLSEEQLLALVLQAADPDNPEVTLK